MKKKRKQRKFSPALKKRVVERIKAGESITALSREYQVERSRLYDWRDQLQAGREFCGSGRPSKSAEGVQANNELDAAQARIAELERKVGQQQMALDFLRGALQQVNQSPSTNRTSGGTASSNTSGE